MTKGKVAILGAAVGVLLLAGAVWAQAVGFGATTVIQTTTTMAGQPIEYPLFRNQVTALLVEILPGGQSGRHMHPAPMFIYVIEGELTYEVDGQPTKVYKPGQAFVEGVRVWHNATNRGSSPVKFLAWLHGEQGVPITIRP
ncbi:MAG: cupin domain-containing protein [Armatimonadota bacterium]